MSEWVSDWLIDWLIEIVMIMIVIKVNSSSSKKGIAESSLGSPCRGKGRVEPKGEGTKRPSQNTPWIKDRGIRDSLFWIHGSRCWNHDGTILKDFLFSKCNIFLMFLRRRFVKDFGAIWDAWSAFGGERLCGRVCCDPIVWSGARDRAAIRGVIKVGFHFCGLCRRFLGGLLVSQNPPRTKVKLP